MQSYLYLEIDLVGLAILLIIYYFGAQDESKLSEQRAFNGLLLTCLVMLVSDIAAWMLEGKGGMVAHYCLHIASFAYFASATFICGQWLVYCYSKITGGLPPQKLRLLFFSPSFLWALVLCINFFTGWIYSYDGANMYHRGPASLAHPALVLGYLLAAAILIYRGSAKRNSVDRHDIRSLVLFIIPPTIGMVFQLLAYGLSTIPVSCTLAALIIMAQRQKALITADHLTGLSNRRSFEHYLERKLQNPPMNQLFFLLMIDIDHFKHLNDVYGRQVGNEALGKIASVLKRACQRSDFISRIGSDAFIVAAQRNTSAEIDALIAAIHAALDKENELPDTPYDLSISIGCMPYAPSAHATVDRFLHDADKQLSAVKRKRQEIVL